MLSCRLGPATGVAINPQISVLEYSRRFVDDFLTAAFESKTPEQLSEDERKRLSVIDAFNHAPETKYVIVQNVLDRVHYYRHFGKFCEGLGVNPAEECYVKDKLKTILYRSPVGHGAEPKEMVNRIIKAALNQDGNRIERLNLSDIHFSAEKENNRFPIKAEQLYFPGAQDAPSLNSGEIIFAPHGRADVAPISMALPFDWSCNPYNDSNWCAQLQKWNMVDSYILAYENTNNSSYLKIAHLIMMDWHRYHIERGMESQMTWRDFIVGMRAMKIAYIVSQWLNGKFDLSKNEETIYLNLIKLHLDFILDPKNIKFTNHTFFDFHGGMALSQVIDSGNRKRVEDFILKLTPKLIASQFDRFGVHLEHSFGYQGFGIRCLERLAKSGWFDRVHIKTLLAKAQEVQEWFLLPDGRVAPIGDTNGQQSPKNQRPVVFKGERQVFNSSGYCIIRSDGKGDIKNSSYFCLMGAFHSNIHKHPDDLSVIWFEGEDILCDPGKFAYKSHIGRRYAQSTRAHNTVEIDESDYSVEKDDAYGSAIKEVSVKEWGYLVVASVNHRKFGVRHTRFCLYQTGSWLLIIDRIISNKVHHFTQWNHFPPQLNIAQTKRGFSAKLGTGRSMHVLYVTGEEPTVQVVSGESKPRLQGWISQGYAQLTPSQALGIHQSGKDVSFGTLFCIRDQGSMLSLKSNGRFLLDVRSARAEEALEIIPSNHNCRVVSQK